MTLEGDKKHPAKREESGVWREGMPGSSRHVFHGVPLPERDHREGMIIITTHQHHERDEVAEGLRCGDTARTFHESLAARTRGSNVRGKSFFHFLACMMRQ